MPHLIYIYTIWSGKKMNLVKGLENIFSEFPEKSQNECKQKHKEKVWKKWSSFLQLKQC